MSLSRKAEIFGLCCALAIAAPAFAQTAGREQIVVTTERRATSAHAEALNVAVLDGDALERIDMAHPQEALNRLPGVSFHRGSGGEHLAAIRSPVLTGGAGAGSFLYLEDGVALRAPGFANVNGLLEATADLARSIEVVRGPGPALYGSNAVHGLVNVITPSPDRERSYVSASIGSLGRARTRAGVERIVGADAFGVHFSAAHEDGWRDDAGLDRQSLLARWRRNGAVWSTEAGFAVVNLNQETAGFITGLNAYADRSQRRRNIDPEAYRDVRATRMNIRIERRAGDNLTFAVTPYARWTDMAFLQHFLPGDPLEENGHWSVGVLATAYGDVGPRFEYLFGVDAEYTEGFLSEFQAAPSFAVFPQGVHYDYEISAPLFAAYSEAEWEFSPGWTLEAGVRVEAVSYDYDNHAPSNDVGRFRRPADRRDAFVNWTPNLALRRELSDNLSAYLRAARGARAPQTTDLYRLQTSQTIAAAQSETVDSLELGLRGEYSDLGFELAAFAMEKESFFFRDADGLNVTDGRTRHRGVELSGHWRAAQWLQLEGAATIARHIYRFDRPVAGAASENIASGDDVDTAPRRLWNMRALFFPSERASIELEWLGVGRYFTDAANMHVYPGHQLFNLRADYELTPQLSVFGAVRNLTDETYAERADYAFGTDRYFPGEERSFTFGLRAEIAP